MIIGMGIDLVDLRRISKVYDKFGCRFLRRILAPGELARLPAQIAPWLGARFAVKEAAAKALGTGFSQGIAPQLIETRKGSLGEPVLVLHGQALIRASSIGARRFHLSLSHERDCAAAIVILED